MYYFVDWPTDQPTDRPAAGRLAGCLPDPPTDWATNRPTDWSTDRPIDLIDWLIDRQTDWLIDGQTNPLSRFFFAAVSTYFCYITPPTPAWVPPGLENWPGTRWGGTGSCTIAHNTLTFSCLRKLAIHNQNRFTFTVVFHLFSLFPKSRSDAYTKPGEEKRVTNTIQ